LVKLFYTNLTLDGKNIVSDVKGIKMKVTSEVWNSVAGIKIFWSKGWKREHKWDSGVQQTPILQKLYEEPCPEYKQIPCR